MIYSNARGDAVSAVSPSSYYPEEKFIYEDLDMVSTYINLAFGVSEGSAKESTAGGASASCNATTPWLLLQ